MSTDISEPKQDSPRPPPRLRTAPKIVLILAVMLVGSWFAAKLIRHQRADEILTRHDAVLDAIIGNIATPPAGTTFESPPRKRDELEKLLGRTWPDPTTRRKAILDFGSPFPAVSTSITLDISEARNDDEEIERLAGRLADVYADGLAAVGLEKVVSGGGANPVAVWKSRDDDLDVIINIDTDPDSQTAEVRILFIDSQSL